MRHPLDASILGGYLLDDLGVVNHMLLELGRRPGKDKNIMAFAGLDLRRCARVNLLHWNGVHDYLCIVLVAPFLGQHILEPDIELRQKMGPFSNLQSLLLRKRAIGEKEEWSKGGRCRRHFKEIPPRRRFCPVPGHSCARSYV